MVFHCSEHTELQPLHSMIIPSCRPGLLTKAPSSALSIVSIKLRWVCSCPPRSLRRPSLEPILKFARHLLHRAHAASAGGLSSLGFHSPVILTDLGGRIAT